MDGGHSFKTRSVPSMRQITLNQNKAVILDDEDYDRFFVYHWCYKPERNGNQGYAITHAKVGRKVKTVYLHREIMGPPPGYEVVFKNFDRLDCRRENLAIVTKTEARRHHRVRRDSKSGIKGVRLNPDTGTWSAYTYRDGYAYRIGTYRTQDEASRAYEAELREENPELANAPERVGRRIDPAGDERNPDAQPSGQA